MASRGVAETELRACPAPGWSANVCAISSSPADLVRNHVLRSPSLGCSYMGNREADMVHSSRVPAG